MEIQYYGGNCIKIATKKTNLVVDDNLKELGVKSVSKEGDIVLFTGGHTDTPAARLVIDQPGEYEVADVSVQGIAARAHMDEEDRQTATIYKVMAEDVRMVFLGHIYPSLTEDQLEALGTVDILFVPVGGHGFTLDAQGALQVIKKIEPKLVVPTNYADKDLKYEVPAEDLEAVIKALSMEPKERLAKLKTKGTDLLGSDQTQLIILERA